MIIQIKKTDVFIPDIEDNLEQPPSEQIKFHFRYASTEERKRYMHVKPMKFRTSKEINDSDMEVEYVQDGEGLAKATVTGIENLSVQNGDGAPKDIKTIAEFYKQPMSKMATQLETHLLNANAVVETKN